ncbi:MAG TPA: hypothetical protein V6C89_04545 [Drouetiella sp.]|jgi:hypothetical protein
MNKIGKFKFMVVASLLMAACPETGAQYQSARQTVKPAVPLTQLSGPINLRNIPVYSGAVFKNGCFHDRNAASETYYSQQLAPKIMDWYVDQIQDQGWKILLKSPTLIMAETKNGDRCKVQVRTIAASTGFRSSIILTRSPI